MKIVHLPSYIIYEQSKCGKKDVVVHSTFSLLNCKKCLMMLYDDYKDNEYFMAAFNKIIILNKDEIINLIKALEL